MAHIRRVAAGSWQVRYRDPSGKERARSFRRRTDAEKFMVTVETDKLRGMWADPRLAKITVSEWLPTWQASRVHLRPSTRALSASLLRNHVLPYFGDRRLGSVTPTEVQGFVAHLEEKGLAPSTVRQCYLLVGGLFTSALDSDIIVRTPCRGINLPEDSKTEMRFLTADEVSDLAGVIDERYRALVLTAAYAGCRFGELAWLEGSSARPSPPNPHHRRGPLRGAWRGEACSPQDGRSSSSARLAQVPHQGAGRSSGRVASWKRWFRVPGSSGRAAAATQLPETHLATGCTSVGRPADALSRPPPHSRGDADRPGRASKGHPESSRALLDQDHPRHLRTPVRRSRRGCRRAPGRRIRAGNRRPTDDN